MASESKNTADRIIDITAELCNTLIAKNANYGDSAGQAPLFAPRLDPATAILVRMSDKVSRLRSLLTKEQDKVGEPLRDTLLDLAGYCLLLVNELDKNGESGENG